MTRHNAAPGGREPLEWEEHALAEREAYAERKAAAANGAKHRPGMPALDAPKSTVICGGCRTPFVLADTTSYYGASPCCSEPCLEAMRLRHEARRALEQANARAG